jgi:hypothetical protein
VKRAALLCAALALAGAIFALKAADKMPDFEVYWRAGGRAAAAAPLYPAEDGHYQHKYLPAFAVLAVPLAWLPLPAAKAIWFTVSAGVLGAFVAMSLGLLPERRKPAWILAACVVIAMAKFYGHELVLGQVNLLLGTVVTGAVHLLRRGRDVPAGLLLALAVVVKPYGLIFFPWLAATRRSRAVLAWIGGMAGAIVLPVPVYGIPATQSLHADWWRTVTASTAPNLLNADNVSLAAMFAKWLGTGAVAVSLAIAASVVVVAVAADVVRRRAGVRDPVGLEAALLLTSIALLSPQGWDYVLLLATPAIAFLANYEDRLPRAMRIAAWIAVATAAFSLFDIMGRQAYAVFMSLSIVTLCFLVVIAALYALRVRRVA